MSRKYTYADFHDEDENLINSFPWKQIQTGKHDVEKDEAEPTLPDTHGFCCSNGCGVCSPLERQYFTRLLFDKDGILREATYHKIYSSSCCPDSEGSLLVYEIKSESVIGEYTPEILSATGACDPASRVTSCS